MNHIIIYLRCTHFFVLSSSHGTVLLKCTIFVAGLMYFANFVTNCVQFLEEEHKKIRIVIQLKTLPQD